MSSVLGSELMCVETMWEGGIFHVTKIVSGSLMEQETLFTAAKWEVLKSLAENSKSPIELAEASNTSLSNISQSLRFLELAGRQMSPIHER